jgi:hypothetical protein
MILVTIVVLYAIGSYRDQGVMAACTAQGGKPVYRTEYREMPDGTGIEIAGWRPLGRGQKTLLYKPD